MNWNGVKIDTDEWVFELQQLSAQGAYRHISTAPSSDRQCWQTKANYSVINVAAVWSAVSLLFFWPIAFTLDRPLAVALYPCY